MKPKRYEILHRQNDSLLLAEASTLAAALHKRDRVDGRVRDRKTGASQCGRCLLFKCDHAR